MRLRATRLSVTGGHTRKRGIDIAALFAAYPGRVGCYYGTKAGPSYSDILARNREALGAEEVPVSAYQSSTNWQLSGGVSIAGGRVVATAAAQYSTGSYYRNLPWGQVYVVTLIVDSVTVGSVRPVFLGGTQVTGTSRTAPGTYVDLMVATEGTNRIGIQFATAGTNTASARVFVQPISDWAKLVLFDDANGTVPVFSVFQSSRGRGLLLDASQGLARGAELCQDVGFDNASLWTLIQPTSGSVTVGGGAATITSVDGSYAAVSPTALNQIPVVGKWYEVSYTVSSATGGGIRVDMAGVPGPVRSGPGAYSHKLQAIGTQTVAVVRGGGVSGGVVTDLSVRELPGNHMVQPTAAARGELSARYNLYDGSEGVNGLVPNGASVSLGYLQETAANSSHFALLNNSTIPAGAGVTTTFRAKGRGRNLRLACTSTAAWVGGPPVAIFDLTAGTSSATGGATASIAPVAGQPGVYDCTMVATMGASSTSTHVYPILIDAVGNTTYLGDGVSGVELIRRDTRLSADAIPSIPAYQRVTSATDYDESGFPVYWRGQTDDWAKSHINPNGATKALVMWAGQKLSDSSESMILETSTASGTTNGSIAVWASVSGGNALRVRSRGTASSDKPTSGVTAAPRRLAVGAYADILADISRITVNGNTDIGTDDQGTGSYTEQDVYFGARAGSSLFSNIREYAPPLILFQPAADTGLSASQVAALDKAYAKAAGVTL